MAEIIQRELIENGEVVGYEYGGRLVRCKDCKYREVQVDGVFRYELCGIRNEIINLEGFCHMGKRREDGNNDRN